MKKTVILLLIVISVFMAFGRPVLAAVLEDERSSVLLFEPVPMGLPGEVFVLALPWVTGFVREYFEQGQLARCLEGYLLTSRERPPPAGDLARR